MAVNFTFSIWFVIYVLTVSANLIGRNFGYTLEFDDK